MFFLVIGGTNVIKHADISAAGASQKMLPYTAALDAEYICLGETKTMTDLPVSPAGIISPAIITRRCLELLNMQPLVINAGAPVTPKLSEKWMIDLGTSCARSVETGNAIEFEEVLRLYNCGRELVCNHPPSPIIIAECVVGGTTTAQGLLTTLGYDVSGMMSSSIPNGNHDLKNKLVKHGYQAASARNDFNPTSNPLHAVSAMGDPMQAVVAGMAVECIESGRDFVLAGGSQMIAIASLVEKITDAKIPIKVATTPWVAKDKSASIQKLLELCCKNTVLSFCETIPSSLQDLPLEAYNQGHVKEGVGAGALIYKLSKTQDNDMLLF